MFRGVFSGRGRMGAADPLRGALGSLEREVMDVVWTAGALAVRDVQTRLARPVAYTTVMTTLDRLFKKGFLVRTRTGRAYVYRAAQSRQELEAAMATGVLSGLLSGNSDAAVPILSNLVDAVGSQGDALGMLERLEDLVRDKRRQVEQRGKETE